MRQKMKSGDLVVIRFRKVSIIGTLVKYWNGTGWWEILTSEGITHWPENMLEIINESYKNKHNAQRYA